MTVLSAVDSLLAEAANCGSGSISRTLRPSPRFVSSSRPTWSDDSARASDVNFDVRVGNLLAQPVELFSQPPEPSGTLLRCPS